MFGIPFAVNCETGNLPLSAEYFGVDFVKTSTGYGTGGAEDKDIRIMRKYSDPKIQIKAAGGVRTLERAIAIKELGCTRFGCTAMVGILERLK